MPPIQLVLSAISSFIAFLTIVLGLGWKHLHKYIPKLPPNKKWAKHFILISQLIVLASVVVLINIWFLSDTTEEGTDFWKMTKPMRDLENQIQTTTENLSNIKLASFHEAMNELPEGIEQLQPIFDAAESFRADGFDEFGTLVENKECDESIEFDLILLKAATSTTKRSIEIQNELLKSSERKVNLRKRITDETTGYEEERNILEKYIKSTIISLEKIMQHFKTSENSFRTRMLESTDHENYQFGKLYLLPAVIIILFSSFSIYTTVFRPQALLSRFFRISLSIFFYAVPIQVIILFLYEVNVDSFVCHLKPEHFQFYNFDIPSSNIPTKEAFTNCISAKASMFYSPDDEIYLPEKSDYFNNVRKKFVKETSEVLRDVYLIGVCVPAYQSRCDEHVAAINRFASTCPKLTTFIETFTTTKSYLNKYLPHGITQDKYIELAEELMTKEMGKLKKVIHDPIINFNKFINASNLDCRSMFNAYQHGYNRSCFFINEQIIRTAKLIVVACSVLCAVIHLLNLRRLEHIIEQPERQVKQAV